MSREEAIRIIKIVLAVAEDFEIIVRGEEFTEEKCKEAVEIVTKALMQEPCDDCISRQTVLNLFREHGEVYVTDIVALPSVQPKKRTGRWIDNLGLVYCSGCGATLAGEKNYCPDCGSFNGGEQDGSTSGTPNP